MTVRIQADFNGFFGEVLCLSHSATALDEAGQPVTLFEGMEVLAFEPDEEEGERIFLVARGRVVPSRESLRHRDSVWSLAVDERGLQRVVSLDDA